MNKEIVFPKWENIGEPQSLKEGESLRIEPLTYNTIQMPNLVCCKILIDKDYFKNNIDFMFKMLDIADYVRKIEYKRDKIILKFEMYSDVFNYVFGSKEKHGDNIIFEYVTEMAEELKNKKGKIKLLKLYCKDEPIHKKLLEHIHILDDEYDPIKREIEYTCIHESFRELKTGDEIPKYQVNYDSEKDIISFLYNGRLISKI